MLSIDIPRYFYLETGIAARITLAEKEYEKRMSDCVI
jgi:hypothetical protein